MTDNRVKTNHQTPILIAGGGPVGLSLARVLSQYGVKCFLVERNPTTTPYPKMDVTNGRTMELFRSIGIADAVRAVGVPDGNSHDITFMTSFTGYEVARINFAPPAEVREHYRRNNDGSQPLEPNLRVSQVIIEPFLKAQSENDPNVTLRYGWGLIGFDVDDEGVTATIAETKTGREETVRAQFLAGCDGATSVTRRGLGIDLAGEPNVRTAYQIHFRSRDLDVIQHHGQAWHYYCGRHGTVIAQDDEEIWTFQHILFPGMSPDDVDVEAALRKLAGRDFNYEVLLTNVWTARALIADSYGEGRVFLAGDSAHQYVPTGGYGMNTGVGDAFDLGWKLAAVINGWGGENLLKSYPLERRPVGERNRERSLYHSRNAMRWREFIGPEFAEDTLAGEENRTAVGAAVLQYQPTENASLGIEFGYRYAGSPICETNGDPEPLNDEVDYLPTSWPGARAPSFYLDDGTALFDRFGRAFTLLHLGETSTAADPLCAAASARGVPLTELKISEARVRDVYDRDLILIRPDGHVAWRGNQLPDDPAGLIDLARGA